MKKKLMIMLAIAVLVAAIPALALSPQPSEAIRRAVAGQTFEARCTGYQSVGGQFSMYATLYERARYSEADIQAMGETDYIDADIGSEMVYSVTPTEDGYTLNESDPNADPVYLIPDGEGCFYARDVEGNFYKKEALEVCCVIAADAEYIDASDPEGEPSLHTAQELIDALQEDRRQFGSVEISFNESGEIIRLQRNPSEEEPF